MYSVPISAVPNQTISFNIDGAFWQVHIYQSIYFMCADVSINGNKIMTGVRCFGGVPLLPYTYMTEPNYGNLVFDSDADWQNFGNSCNLFFLEKDELQEFELMLLVGEDTES